MGVREEGSENKGEFGNEKEVGYMFELSTLCLTASVSLAYLILVLSVIDLEIVCDSNKLPNHLIDGWEEGFFIVRWTFP